MPRRVLTVATFAAGLAVLLCAATGLAGDTDPTGIKLKEALKDPAAQKVLKEKGATGAGGQAEITDPTGILCLAEGATGVGLIIWDQRRKADKCPNIWKETALDYCMDYSLVCDHYHWDPDCLRQKHADEPDFCNP